jgi:hypothetical protein
MGAGDYGFGESPAETGHPANLPLQLTLKRLEHSADLACSDTVMIISIRAREECCWYDHQPRLALRHYCHSLCLTHSLCFGARFTTRNLHSGMHSTVHRTAIGTVPCAINRQGCYTFRCKWFTVWWG